MDVARDHSVSPPVMGPETSLNPTQMDKRSPMEETRTDEQKLENFWLSLSRDAWQSSQTWWDSSMRTQLERAYAHFRGVHAPGSKYLTDQYARKSKIFRPKTRSSIRRTEASAAVAFFSTHDVVHCQAEDDNDPKQQLAADVHNAILNRRLNRPRRDWFMTLMGACQDAATTGIVISKQDWDFELAEQAEVQEMEDGSRKVVSREELLSDRPRIKLLPTENFRFSPAADWIDPVNTSPYTIEITPTYVYQIMERAQRGEYYSELRRDVVGAASQQDWDSVRQAREGGHRIDKYDNPSAISDFQIVWVYHYIVRVDGQDWCYDTLGQEYLLQDPIPISARYPHCRTGDRPYRLGCAMIEVHKNYPGGIPQMIDDLQQETNDLANLRLDSLKHWINPHWLVRRGRGTDLRSLIRNTPSGVTLTTDVTADVKELTKQGLPSAAFSQEDRLNLDIDDIIGNFSQSSVQTNRSMNETVGGMNMIAGDANLLQEYTIRTIALTWAQPVLQQVVKMESVYEDDQKILNSVASSLGVTVDEVIAVLGEDVEVNVDMGFGATNPEKRIAKLAMGLQTMAAYFPDEMQQADRAEVSKEIFGAMGFDDGTRFFPHLKKNAQEDPRVAQMQKEIAELQQLLAGKQMEIEGRITVAQIAADAKKAGDQMRQQTEVLKLQSDGDQKRYATLLDAKLKSIDKQLASAKDERESMQLWMEREALSQHILESNREWALKVDQITRSEVAGTPEQDDTNGAMDLPGNDRAGRLSRNQYDLIPENAQ